jgi:hypothetical protein
MAESSGIMSDCLHCDLMDGVREYQKAHRCDCEKRLDSCVSVSEILNALADVVGDRLSTDGSWPHRQYFLDRIEKRVKKRIAFVKEQGWLK